MVTMSDDGVTTTYLASHVGTASLATKAMCADGEGDVTITTGALATVVVGD